MREVGGALAEVRQHGRLDRLHSFRLLGVVGDAVFRAVGVRDEERALAVVAAAGARRHRRRLFAFFLPRRNASRRRLVQASLRPAVCAAASVVGGELLTRCSRVVAQSSGAFSLTEQRPQLASPAHCSTTTGKSCFLQA